MNLFISLRLLLAFCMYAVAGSAMAQAYVGIDGSWSKTNNVHFDLANAAIPDHPTEYKKGSALGLRAGWQFAGSATGAPRVEIELSWRRNKIDGFSGLGTVAPGTGTHKARALMVNGLFDFNTDSAWVPYVGLGLGRLSARADDIRQNISPPECCTGIVDGKDSASAWQAILGIGYRINEHTMLTFDYRHLSSFGGLSYGYRVGCSPDGSFCLGQPGSTSARYRNQTLSVGLRYSF